MPLLSTEVKKQVQKELAELESPVRLAMFTQEFECQYCRETRQMAEELAELSEQVTAEIYNFVVDKEKADELGVDKIPALAILGKEDHGVRMYGIPAGYEFTSLIQAMKNVAAGTAHLAEETLEFLRTLEQPVHFQVFVTPTCPYCPPAVVLAHQMAIASPMVTADMVESSEFPHLAVKYDVMGVPRTVINETVHIEGAAAEPLVLEKLKAALSPSGA